MDNFFENSEDIFLAASLQDCASCLHTKINVIIYLKFSQYEIPIAVLIHSVMSSCKNVVKDLKSTEIRKEKIVELIELERERLER